MGDHPQPVSSESLTVWKIRLATYLAGFLAVLATILAAVFGWGTYDHATGLFDPPPIDVKALAGWIVTGIANAIAALALIRGWGRK
jgi:hypothetical protein